MAHDLKEIMDALAEVFETTCEPYRKGYSMTLRTGAGRTQTIRAMLKTRDGHEIMMVYTPVGKFDSYTDLATLLSRNVETLYARVAVLEQSIIVMAASILEETSLKEARIAVEEVARVGDELESQIFGVDQH